MVQTLQRDQVQKEYSEIVFNLYLRHVGEFEPCQTRSNIFTFFLSPSWRLGPKILYFYFMNSEVYLLRCLSLAEKLVCKLNNQLEASFHMAFSKHFSAD